MNYYPLCKKISHFCSENLMLQLNSHVYCVLYSLKMGTTVAQWLRCCATSRKVAGSIPAGVIGILH